MDYTKCSSAVVDNLKLAVEVWKGASLFLFFIGIAIGATITPILSNCLERLFL